jgi:predicted ester cyclase
MTQSVGKVLVARLVNEVINQGRLDVIDEIYDPGLAPAVRRWIEPFLTSFSDVDMRVVQLVEEGDVVVGRFTCSGTHSAVWRGHPATNRRFHAIAEVYFFRVSDRRIIWAWGLEDTDERLRQLGLS